MTSVAAPAPSLRRASMVLAPLALLYASVLWTVTYPPMQDAAAHAESACQLWRVWRGDDAFVSMFTVQPMPWANSLPTVLLAALYVVAPKYAMLKLMLTLATVAWPLSLALLFARLGRSPWLALLALPTTYDLAWSYGFVQFICAKPLVCVALWAAHKHVVVGGKKNAAALAAALALVFVTHSLAWLLALAGCAIIMVLCATEPTHRWRLVALTPGVLVAVPFFWRTRDAGAGGAVVWRAPLDALAAFADDLFNTHPGGVEAVVYAGVLAVAVFVVFAARATIRERSRERTAVFAIATLWALCWFLGPSVLPQVSVVSPRLLSFSVAMALGALPFPVARLKPIVFAMAILSVVAVADLTLAWRRFSDVAMGDFDALLHAIADHARVATSYTTPFSPDARHNALWHWGKLSCLTSAATTDDMFAYRKTAYVALAHDDAMRPPHRLRADALAEYQMLLLSGDVRAVQGLGSSLALQFETGTWHLYRVMAP